MLNKYIIKHIIKYILNIYLIGNVYTLVDDQKIEKIIGRIFT